MYKFHRYFASETDRISLQNGKFLLQLLRWIADFVRFFAAVISKKLLAP
jgi:hypothetical protein